MKNGKKLVHHYFSEKMNWKAEKGNPDQYLNVNFRADWVGAAIDDHVEQHVRARLAVSSKAAEEMIELLQQRVLEQDDIIARLGRRIQELEKDGLSHREALNPFHVKAPT